VQERVHCYKCFVSTHEHDYTQYFYNVMAKGIGDQEARLPGQPLGRTLTELESHSLKSCDDEKGTVRLSHVHCCCCFATSGWQVCMHITFPAAGAYTTCWHQPSRTTIQESSKNSVVSVHVSLLLAQLLQHVRCACRRVWGQEPCAALPGVSATQGLHNAAGLADRQ